MGMIFKAGYKVYQWLVYMPYLAVSTVVFGSLAVLLASLVGKKLASIVGGQWWARTNAFLAWMCVTKIGKENIDPDQSYVVVANHLSLFDIFVLYGWLGIDFRWVMKQELRKVPGLGAGCAAIGHVFIDRSNHEKAIESINKAKREITKGVSVLFFPEGTRSKTGELQEFKKGAFKFALDMGLPILPITLVNTNIIQPTGTLDINPGRAGLIIHPAIESSDYNDTTIDQLIAQTHAVIKSGLPS